MSASMQGEGEEGERGGGGRRSMQPLHRCWTTLQVSAGMHGDGGKQGEEGEEVAAHEASAPLLDNSYR